MSEDSEGIVDEGRHVAHPQHRFSLPDGAREIILVRHGSSEGTTPRKLMVGGRELSDPALSDDGHMQAQALSKRLLAEQIDHVFVSPMMRTHQTAAPFLAVTGLGLSVIDTLHEVFMGDWEHEYHLHVENKHPWLRKMVEERSWEVIPNAETLASVEARLRLGLAQIVGSMDAGQTGLAILHGGVIGEICRMALRIPPMVLPSPENTSVSRVVIRADGRWVMRSYNDVSHLLLE